MSRVEKLTDREIKALFDMPPEKAIEHLKSKGLHIGWDWTDTHALAHARSFTVAKMTALDMLSTTKKAIEQAMMDGTGYKDFETTIKPYRVISMLAMAISKQHYITEHQKISSMGKL